MEVTLPQADAAHVGQMVAVRWDPESEASYLLVKPQGSDLINGYSWVSLSALGHCLIFIVASAGSWWIAAEYYP